MMTEPEIELAKLRARIKQTSVELNAQVDKLEQAITDHLQTLREQQKNPIQRLADMALKHVRNHER